MTKRYLSIICILICLAFNFASCESSGGNKESVTEGETVTANDSDTTVQTDGESEGRNDDKADDDYDVIDPDDDIIIIETDGTEIETEPPTETGETQGNGDTTPSENTGELSESTLSTESEATSDTESNSTNTESSAEGDTAAETDHEHSFDGGTVISPTFDAGGYTEYTCTVCGEKKQEDAVDMLVHSFADAWSHDEVGHWKACIDEGYSELKDAEGEHTMVEVVVTDSTPDETGILKTYCTVCTYFYETSIPRKTHIVSIPSVDESKCLVGMPLSSIALVGGEGSVAGSFTWTYPDTTISENGNYEITFTPHDPEDSPISASVSIKASWLTVEVIAGENGSARLDCNGKVSYNGSFSVIVEPKFGYEIDSFTVNGKSSDTYTLENVTENKTVRVSFKKLANPVSINCLVGNDGCYSISGGTLTISGITSNTVYSISGEAIGNIVIDVDPAYTFELELAGLKLTSYNAAPISVLNGDKVTLSAKKSYTNYIIDNRVGVSGSNPATFPAAIYSLVDLDVEGKGTLDVSSPNNGGIYTKKDLQLKNLTLSVNCRENALRGNDSVEIVGGNLTVIATHGDAVKTKNSNISQKGNQKGNVTVTGGVHKIYAAGDGISAAHDVIISDSTTSLSIFTDTFSTYAKLKTRTSSDTVYIRTESKDYSYSIRFANKDGTYAWSDATYVGEQFIDGEMAYFYAVPKKSGFTHVAIFSYTGEQAQGQSKNYHLKTGSIPQSKGYDTIAVKFLEDTISFRFTSYQLVEGGVYTVGEHSSRGIKASNSITVSGGTVTVKSHGDAIKANNDGTLENGNAPTGNIIVTGGTLNITTYATAILAEGDLTVSGGSVTVNDSFTGLSGDTVDTTGAQTSIIAIYKTTKTKN